MEIEIINNSNLHWKLNAFEIKFASLESFQGPLHRHHRIQMQYAGYEVQTVWNRS